MSKRVIPEANPESDSNGKEGPSYSGRQAT